MNILDNSMNILEIRTTGKPALKRLSNFNSPTDMGRKKRRFFPTDLQHCYQRTIYGSLIFYSKIDFLVFLTVFSIRAKVRNMKVLAVCPMPDHLHSVTWPKTIKDFCSFTMSYTSTFVRLFNADVGRKGPLFRDRFGSANKYGDKKKRDCLAYNYNNAPEKKLVARCEDYRWNLLAYAVSGHPYSEEIKLEEASSQLLRAILQVKKAYRSDRYLGYGILRKMFKGLSSKEEKQLIDFILSTYTPIDYETLVRFYGSYGNMLKAFNSNTGDEYDIKEDYSVEPDTAYLEMVAVLKAKGFKYVKTVIVLSEEKKLELLRELKMKTSGSERQIRKFLHLPPLK